MNDLIDTLIIEPVCLVRDGIHRLLSEPPFRVAATLASVPEGEMRETIDGPPRLIILGLAAGHLQVSAVAEVRRLFPRARIAVLVDRFDREEMDEAVRLGACAYLLRTLSTRAFLGALTIAVTEEMMVLAHRDQPEKAPAASPLSLLSPREMTILGSLKEGDSNKLIARKLDIAEATVKCHVKMILRKLNVKSRFEAAIWAMRAGERSAFEAPDPAPLRIIETALDLREEALKFPDLAGAGRPRLVGTAQSF